MKGVDEKNTTHTQRQSITEKKEKGKNKTKMSNLLGIWHKRMEKLLCGSSSRKKEEKSEDE